MPHAWNRCARSYRDEREARRYFAELPLHRAQSDLQGQFDGPLEGPVCHVFVAGRGDQSRHGRNFQHHLDHATLGTGHTARARLCAGEKRSSAGVRAQRASSSLSPRMFERSVQGTRSELRGASRRGEHHSEPPRSGGCAPARAAQTAHVNGAQRPLRQSLCPATCSGGMRTHIIRRMCTGDDVTDRPLIPFRVRTTGRSYPANDAFTMSAGHGR